MVVRFAHTNQLYTFIDHRLCSTLSDSHLLLIHPHLFCFACPNKMDPGAENVRAPAPQGRVYRGDLRNQKDPRAVNAWQAPAQPKGPRFQKPFPLSAAAELPPPTKRHDASKALISESHPSETSLFASNMSVRETVPRQTFSPSTPALIDISCQIYTELITNDNSLSKVLLPEYLDYYSTVMLWLRIANLKLKNSQPVTIEEEGLIYLTQTSSFIIPELLNL